MDPDAASTDPGTGSASAEPETGTSVEPPEGRAVIVYSDLACPWAHVQVHRLSEIRRRCGLDDAVTVDHRAFPLELVNRRPTPKATLDQEIVACKELEPAAGWSSIPEPWTYPVSTLAGLEAVQAARAQGAKAAEALDLALRRAMFAEWRCIAVHGVVLEIAETVPGLDVDELWAEIRSGRPRNDVWHQYDTVTGSDIPGSPSVVLSDGSIRHNPGIRFHHGDDDEIVIDEDDPSVLDDLVQRTASSVPAE